MFLFYSNLLKLVTGTTVTINMITQDITFIDDEKVKFSHVHGQLEGVSKECRRHIPEEVPTSAILCGSYFSNCPNLQSLPEHLDDHYGGGGGGGY